MARSRKRFELEAAGEKTRGLWANHISLPIIFRYSPSFFFRPWQQNNAAASGRILVDVERDASQIDCV